MSPEQPSLNLVVLRCADLRVSERFYRRIGLDFQTHRHGNGSPHLACAMQGCVFELYPASTANPPSSGTRVGFRVNSMQQVMETFVDEPTSIVSKPSQSEWGLRAVLVDPDGHKIELIESPTA